MSHSVNILRPVPAHYTDFLIDTFGDDAEARRASLESMVKESILAERYWGDIFDDREIRYDHEGNAQVNCPFHEDSTPSYSINKNGKSRCFGCSAKHANIVSFHRQVKSFDTDYESAAELYHLYMQPTIPMSVVMRYHEMLFRNQHALRYCTKTRGLTKHTLRLLLIGFDGQRITFPVFDEFGLCVNIRRYSPEARTKGGPKVINYKDPNLPELKFGSPPRLWPGHLTISDDPDRFGGSRRIFITEGEWDAASLINLGLRAVTTTGGAGTFRDEFAAELYAADPTVEPFIIYDNDNAGEDGAKMVIGRLSPFFTRMSQIIVPQEVGKDVSDWIRHSPSDWETIKSRRKILDEHRQVRVGDGSARKTRKPKKQVRAGQYSIVALKPSEHPTAEDAEFVPLDQLSRPSSPERLVRFRATVTESYDAINPVIKRVHAKCNKSCAGCPMKSTAGESSIYVDECSDLILKFAHQQPDKQANIVEAALRAKCDPNGRCTARLSLDNAEWSTWQAHTLGLTPDDAIDSPDALASFPAYIAVPADSDPMRPATPYEMLAYVRPDKVNHLTAQVFSAKPTADDIGSFRMTPEIDTMLSEFCANGRTEDAVMDRLLEIAEDMATSVTRIYDRPMLHILVDLVMHSTDSFWLGSEVVKRGMLDALVVGDTRCGKTQVAAQLIRHYGMGEMISGENVSFAGLAAGVNMKGRHGVTIEWGALVRQHRRFVAIDEMHSMRHADIGKLSRVRSEGVVEVQKLKASRAPAKVRLLWFANPRSGSSVHEVMPGVKLIPETMGAPEDIARLDLAMVVSSEDVTPEIMDEYLMRPVTPIRFSRSQCRDLLTWVWSRTTEQVSFSKAAHREVLSLGRALSQIYVSDIPLVQPQNIRIKLARIAAAIAARLYSTPRDNPEVIDVKRAHVRAAYELINRLYTHPNMGYDDMSERTINAEAIRNASTVKQVLHDFADQHVRGLAQCALAHSTFTMDHLMTYVGDIDTARQLIQRLCHRHLITPSTDMTSRPIFRQSRVLAKWAAKQGEIEDDSI